MLKHISPLISPDLLKILSEMGHGDTIVLGDANYPAMSGAAPHHLRADGIPIPELLDAILDIFPLDTFVPRSVTLMSVVDGDDYKPDVWDEYRILLRKHGAEDERIEYLERMAYYTQADTAYCVVATGERRRYANIMLKKGIIEPGE